MRKNEEWFLTQKIFDFIFIYFFETIKIISPSKSSNWIEKNTINQRNNKISKKYNKIQIQFLARIRIIIWFINEIILRICSDKLNKNAAICAIMRVNLINLELHLMLKMEKIKKRDLLLGRRSFNLNKYSNNILWSYYFSVFIILHCFNLILSSFTSFSSFTSLQRFFWLLTNKFIKPKLWRWEPGAIFKAIIAASINNVPEPQNKSTTGDFWSHSLKPTNPAAKFSFKGASPVMVR